MKLRIKNKEKELKYNIGFIRRLDEIHSVEVDVLGVEMQFGVGLVSANVQLGQYSPTILSDIIRAAAECTQAEADKAIEDYAEKEGSLEKLFKEVSSELKKSPVVKTTLKKMMGEAIE